MTYAFARCNIAAVLRSAISEFEAAARERGILVDSLFKCVGGLGGV